MTIVWSLPVRGERLAASRGDLVRARALVEALRADGHRVTVVASADRRIDRIAVAGYRRWVRSRLPLGAGAGFRDAGRVAHGCVHGLRVARTACEIDADLIIETQVAYALSGALASRLAGVPLVLDDCSPSAEELAHGASVQWLARLALARQARAARAVVAVSGSLRAKLAAEGLSPAKIRLVPNGIDPGAFASASAPGRRPADWPTEACILGFAGSFQPWHRVELLFEAMATLPRDLPLHVVLVGDGPGLGPALAAAADRGFADRVTPVGAVSSQRIPGLVAHFDIGVLPDSNDYGHPMKLLEYGAAAVPSVAPDVPPVRDVVEPLVTGLLFPRGDAAALAAAIARLAGDPGLRRRLGQNARVQALATGSWLGRARALLAAAACPGDPVGTFEPWTRAHRRPASGAPVPGA